MGKRCIFWFRLTAGKHEPPLFMVEFRDRAIPTSMKFSQWQPVPSADVRLSLYQTSGFDLTQSLALPGTASSSFLLPSPQPPGNGNEQYPNLRRPFCPCSTQPSHYCSAKPLQPSASCHVAGPPWPLRQSRLRLETPESVVNCPRNRRLDVARWRPGSPLRGTPLTSAPRMTSLAVRMLLQKLTKHALVSGD